MKTHQKSILAIIAILLCACYNLDPTFRVIRINDNATKVSNITTTSAEVIVSIFETESGDHYNGNHTTLEVYYSTLPDPFQGLSEHKSVHSADTYTISLSNLEPGTTYYYAAQLGNQRGAVRSFKTKSALGKENGHEWIDLGLSVKWASCNVGASTPEGYGDYFAWGETSSKNTYNYSTYKHTIGDNSTMIKYGKVDNKIVLDPEDDAAHVNWGGNWRMPTKAELEELTNNCTWTSMTQNGVNGLQVKGKNGMSIFLPFAGGYNAYGLQDVGSSCEYWSSSNCFPSSYYADNFYYDFSDCAYLLSSGRKWCYLTKCAVYAGEPVRAVCPK